MISPEDDQSDDRPPTPLEEDCCGNACNPCIFDVHKKLLDEWNKKKLTKLNIASEKKNYLSPIRYSKFIVDKVTEACQDCIFIHLDCGSEKDEDVLFIYPSQHLMIKLGSVTKPYTPISWSQKNVKLLVKLYPNGKASKCFKKLKKGDEVLVRGPYGEFKYKRNSYQHILMLSIGSGVAATYPLANSIVKDEFEDTRIHMILGFRSILCLPLKEALRRLSDYWNYECTVYFSQRCDVNITGIDVVNGRLSAQKIREILDSYSSETTLILICGTPEFNETAEKIVIENKFSHFHVFR